MFERKHVFFKNLATMMRNFVNPCFTFANRHQIFIVLWLKNSDFLHLDFFDPNRRPFQGRLNSIIFKFEVEPTILRDDPRFQVKNSSKCLLQQLYIERGEYYMHIKKYFKDSNGEILAGGFVFRLKSRTKRDLGRIDTVQQCKDELLEFYSTNLVYVNVRMLHHRHHFWLYDTASKEYIFHRGLM